MKRMKTRTKLANIMPILLLVVLLTDNFATIFSQSTETPNISTSIKHVVVIFRENVSFDHYFGNYPNSANPLNESKFTQN